MKLFETEVIGSQVVLQFANAVFDIGPWVVVAPDEFGQFVTVGDEYAKGISGNIDQAAANTGAALANSLSNDDKPARYGPALQSNSEFTHGVVVVQFAPFFYSLGFAFDPRGETSDYNVGQTKLFKKCE